MPLANLDIWRCRTIDLGAALEQLRKLPLTSLSLDGCTQLQGGDLVSLKGLQLAKLSLRFCFSLTYTCLEHLCGMPLKEVDVSGCDFLTGEGLRKAGFIKKEGVPGRMWQARGV